VQPAIGLFYAERKCGGGTVSFVSKWKSRIEDKYADWWWEYKKRQETGKKPSPKIDTRERWKLISKGNLMRALREVYLGTACGIKIVHGSTNACPIPNGYTSTHIGEAELRLIPEIPLEGCYVYDCLYGVRPIFVNSEEEFLSGYGTKDFESFDIAKSVQEEFESLQETVRYMGTLSKPRYRIRLAHLLWSFGKLDEAEREYLSLINSRESEIIVGRKYLVRRLSRVYSGLREP
jgi:hypothetical protein